MIENQTSTKVKRPQRRQQLPGFNGLAGCLSKPFQFSFQ